MSGKFIGVMPVGAGCHTETGTDSRHRHAELFRGALEMLAVVEQLAQESDYITILYEDQLPAAW